MLGGLTPVLLRVAASDENKVQAVIRVLLMQAGQLGGEFVAGSALRIAEDQEDAPAPVSLERNRAALKVGQAETGRGSAGLQAVARDAAFGERPLARKLGAAGVAVAGAGSGGLRVG